MIQSARRWGPLALLLFLGCSNRTEATPLGHPQPVARSTPNPADVEFITGMIHHHAQAVLIAGWAKSHGASDAVQRLCERIVVSQRDEIALMSSWLKRNGVPVPEPSPTGMKMNMDGEEHVMLMPGMLTEAQLKELDAARGDDFDRLFLKDMIQHHQGALEMVQKLWKSYGAAQDEFVFRFSTDVSADQSTEVARMQKMLAQLELFK